MNRTILAAFIILASSLVHAGNLCDEALDCEGFADAFITEDSRGWFFNRYDRGSARLDRVWESRSGMKTEVRIDYTYNGGRHGWAEFRFYDDEFQCVRYHDFPDTCRSHMK